MADKYTKVKPKVHPLTISAIVGFFVIVIGIIIVLQPSNRESIYNAYSPYSTNDLTEDHPFYEVNYKSTLFNKGLKTRIEDDELVFVYIGSPDCTSCQAHIGAFQKYYESLEMSDYVDTIYYLNPGNDLDQFEDFVADYEGVAETTPQLIVFQDGEILYQFSVVSAEDTQLLNRSVRDFYEEVIDLLAE
ncbi:MAG: thioredoxin family protein [Acholeplasmataceae bacterium]|nr:thioredoxin family protein [Acholeplasmataceae bacterium]